MKPLGILGRVGIPAVVLFSHVPPGHAASLPGPNDASCTSGGTNCFLVNNPIAGFAAINAGSTGTGSPGVSAYSNSGYAVQAVSGSSTGVLGATVAAFPESGVEGLSNAASGGVGVYGHASDYGIYGESSSGSFGLAGVYGTAATGGTGVFGHVTAGDGVIGTTTSTGTGVYGESTGGAGYGVYGFNNNSGGYGVYGLNSGGGYAGYFSGNVGITGTPKANQSTFSSLSDARLKKNIKPLDNALATLLRIHGVTFEWNEPAKHGNQAGVQRGFIAQDIEKVMPGWILVEPDGMKAISIPGRAFEAMVVESIRMLNDENESLKARIAALEHRGSVSSLGVGNTGVLFSGLIGIGGLLALVQRRAGRKTQSLTAGGDGRRTDHRTDHSSEHLS